MNEGMLATLTYIVSSKLEDRRKFEYCRQLGNRGSDNRGYTVFERQKEMCFLTLTTSTFSGSMLGLLNN